MLIPTARPLQARIALLEGERRSFDNIKVDLMRRIKMLEYALRVERSVAPLARPPARALPHTDTDVSPPPRSKQLTQPAASSSQQPQPAPKSVAGQQPGAQSQKDDVLSNKEGSSGSSPRSEGPSSLPSPVAIHPVAYTSSTVAVDARSPSAQTPRCLLTLGYRTAIPPRAARPHGQPPLPPIGLARTAPPLPPPPWASLRLGAIPRAERAAATT